jgi:ATP-dependent HslUV protease subunit HslV
VTTIAYKDGVVAADTQITTGGGWRASSVQKIHRAGPYIFGGCGDLGDLEMFRSWVKKGLPGAAPIFTDDDSECFIIMPDRSIVCLLSKGKVMREYADYYAWGSGCRFAIGAMACGASAEDAVRIAAKHDCGTGLDGGMTVLRLDLQ